jgi:hypothetical protein
MEASLDTGKEEYVTMETAPLDTAIYVEEREEAKIDLLQSKPISYFSTKLDVHFDKILNLSGGFQRLRQGQVVRHLKQLKRPSRSSANSDEDPEVFDALVSDHEKYAVLVQSFSDTLTPDEFCQWRNKDAISKTKRQYVSSLSIQYIR